MHPAVDHDRSPEKQADRLLEQQEQSGTSIINSNSDGTIINGINRHQRNQRNQSQAPVAQKEAQKCESSLRKDGIPQTEPGNPLKQGKKCCPHHPWERRVRFDATGQAWCDHLDCWHCYRLMKIGEALAYPCLIDRGGQRLIEPSQGAWLRFVRTQRAFLIVVATQEAIAACRKLHVEIPDLSEDVSRLETTYPPLLAP